MQGSEFKCSSCGKWGPRLKKCSQCKQAQCKCEGQGGGCPGQRARREAFLGSTAQHICGLSLVLSDGSTRALLYNPGVSLPPSHADCDKQCQLAHWRAGHKAECAQLAAAAAAQQPWNEGAAQ